MSLGTKVGFAFFYIILFSKSPLNVSSITLRTRKYATNFYVTSGVHEIIISWNCLNQILKHK